VTDETGWLLLRKTDDEDGNEEDGELRAWMCWGVDEASLEELVSWAQVRWCVEQFHRDIKQNLGVDEYQGRTWKGVHHYCEVVILAHAFVVRRRFETGESRSDFLSFEEVVNLIVRESAIQGLIDDKGCNRESGGVSGVYAPELLSVVGANLDESACRCSTPENVVKNATHEGVTEWLWVLLRRIGYAKCSMRY